MRRFVADLSWRALSPKRINFVVQVFRMVVRVAVRRHVLREAQGSNAFPSASISRPKPVQSPARRASNAAW